MTKNKKLFKFKFSLEILNHLGKGLYRSFATVVAEAVSNSWDAEATEVNITIEKDRLVVEDNGKGMSHDDFQKKFLKVGYSRRKDTENKSKRNVIGRKGIGKLAMLSISNKVTIFSRKENEEVTGGKINNKKLDQKIKEDSKYALENITNRDIEKNFKTKYKSGTKIIFEDFKTKLNSEDIIKKYLATQFNFIFSLKKDDSFRIIVNGEDVSEKNLKELNDNTQFLWILNKDDEVLRKRFSNLVSDKKKVISGKVIKDTEFEFNKKTVVIKGFIATVKKSNGLIMRGSGGDFRAGVNLFTNGRLRQENLIEEITTKGLAEEYMYGEIHVDGFEDEKIDRFTSSREGIIKDDPLYLEFLVKLKEIIAVIIKDWTPWRVEIREDGDIDKDNRPSYVVRMEQGKNYREKDFKKKIEDTIKDVDTKKRLKDKLKDLSDKNTVVYQDLFILENLFREYIKIKGITLEDLRLNLDKNIKDCVKKINNTKKDRQEDEVRHSLGGKIVKEDHYTNYIDFVYLGILIDIIVDKKHEKISRYQLTLESDTKEITPIRNVVMHTNEITDDVIEWGKIKKIIDYMDKLF